MPQTGGNDLMQAHGDLDVLEGVLAQIAQRRVRECATRRALASEARICSPHATAQMRAPRWTSAPT